MKQLALLAFALGLATSACADGYFMFNNMWASFNVPYDPYIPHVILPGDPPSAGPAMGSDPTYATPNYVVGFRYVLGRYTTMDSFYAARPIWGAQTATFFAPTGDLEDGAGFFDGGMGVISGAPAGVYSPATVQGLAWYDPTGTTTYDQALALGYNTDQSQLLNIMVSGDGPLTPSDDLSTMVWLVPEPSTLALLVLGGLMLLARKTR